MDLSSQLLSSETYVYTDASPASSEPPVRTFLLLQSEPLETCSCLAAWLLKQGPLLGEEYAVSVDQGFSAQSRAACRDEEHF